MRGAKIILAPRIFVVYTPRRSSAVSMPPDSITATLFCVRHPGRSLAAFSVFTIICSGSFANAEDAPTLARCSGNSTEAAGHVQRHTDTLQGARHSNAGVGYLNDLEGACKLIRRSADGHSSDRHGLGSTCFQCRGYLRLELFDYAIKLRHLKTDLFTVN